MKVEEVEVTKETEKQVTATHSEIEKILAKSSSAILHELRDMGVIDDAESHMMFVVLFARLCAKIDEKLFKED